MGAIVVSAHRDRVRAILDREYELSLWVRELRKGLPVEDVLDRVRSRLHNADAEDRDALTFELKLLLTETRQYDEALRLIDSVIEQKPDDVRYPISKAELYLWHIGDLERALTSIDFALQRALRTRFFRREVLNAKARILLDLGRGEALGEVLEQIMSLDMYREFPDIQRERDFVDRAPPGLIRNDIVARYNEFCPNRDRQRKLVEWIDRQRRELSRAEAIDRVQSRLQDASDEDKFTLAFHLQDLFVKAERYDEALRLIDGVITQNPDNVTFPTAKATIYLDDLDDPDKALECIDLALERASRTRFYRRGALGVKARILVKLGRGGELEQVLEQIMSLQIFPEIMDIARERDFVDVAPSGLIAEDIVARYNKFCSKIDGN